MPTPSSPTPRDLFGTVASGLFVLGMFTAPVLGAAAQTVPADRGFMPAPPSAPAAVRLHVSPTAPAPEAPVAPKASPALAPTPTPSQAELDDHAAAVPKEATPLPHQDTLAERRALRAAITQRQARAEQAPRKAAPKTRRKRCVPDHEGVESLGARTWRVERTLIQHYASSIKRFNSLGWSRPWRDDDTDRKGWQIGGFGCGSPLVASGLRPRDVIQRVNGRKTHNAMQLFGLWTSWKRHDTFEIQVLRRGKEITLRYEVV